VRSAVGLVLVAAGWLGARDEVALDRQSPWIAVSVAGLVVAAASAAAWLLQLRREVTMRSTALVGAVALLEARAPASVRPTADAIRVRRTRGGSLYHRAGCALVAGRAVKEGDPARFGKAGLTPCEACGA
jgi:hypothetical protein